ncbi:MAG: ABC transporter [Halobacteriales archaeon SW_9_67_24]|jgi:branched-chain amino acid transport system substrate-binding protein|nr:MAG: ABC transporter [Halobacteriales archaeon SW_9_67_24]
MEATMSDRSSNSSSDDGRINRRKYLAITAVGTVGFAGCTGGGGGGGDTEGDGDTQSGTTADDTEAGTTAGDTQSGTTVGDTEAGTTGGNGGGGEGAIPFASFCPLSGAGGAFGPGQQAGFNLALEDMNSAGGILGGRQFTPINRNTETKPSRAASKLQTVISNENIEAFVGTWSSGVSSTLAPIAADNEIMQMGNGTTSPTLAEQGWVETGDGLLKYMGRTSPNDGAQGLAMGGLLNDTIGADSAAFMHVDNPYGSGLAQKAKAAFNGETTAIVPVAKQTSNYSSALDEVFADDPDVFGLIVYPANGESILKQWNRGGYGGTLVMSESMFLQDLFDSLSDILMDSYITTVRPDRNDESYSYFTSALNERMDQEPTTFSSHSYDAAILTGLAAHKAGEFTGTAIARNIKSVSRPPGEKVPAGSEGFERAIGLLDEGTAINYAGASSKANLNCFVEPYNRFSSNQLVEGEGGIETEELSTIPASFFEGKLYTDEQLEEYGCEASASGGTANGTASGNGTTSS